VPVETYWPALFVTDMAPELIRKLGREEDRD
jgi:hypothetical protein